MIDDLVHSKDRDYARIYTMRNIKSKFICTIGPSTSDEGKIERLIRDGMSVMRVNLAHTSHSVALIIMPSRKRPFTLASLTS